MPTPSTEQQCVIDDTSRIRIVRAAPGSGKTWLVGQIIKKEIESWNQPGGIAALSFTRVGGEEIRKAVGYELNLPHFVGTLDSFLFKYIVKPFLSKCYRCKEPRLIPAFYGSKFWNLDDVKCKFTKYGAKPTIYNLFDIDYGKSESGSIKLLYSYSGEKKEVPQEHISEIFQKKELIWKQYGWVSHSDVHYLAFRILRNHLGSSVISTLEKRFPFIIVDELQDTGYFICEFFKELLSKSKIRALLVGDPNQSIYEFNGATPEMFDTFKELNESKEIQLLESRRCSKKIVNVANQISPDCSRIKTIKEEDGKTIMVCYNKASFASEVNRVIKQVKKDYLKGQIIKAIARNTSTINELKNHCGEKDIKTIGAPVLTHVTRGVHYFLLKQNAKAIYQVSDALSLLLFKEVGLNEDKIKEKKIDLFLWKETVCQVLLSCVKQKVNQVTYKEWQENAKQDICRILKDKTFLNAYVNDDVLKKMNPQNRDGARDQVSLFLQIPKETLDIPLLTVHGVKGETHDATIFICPPKKRGISCPSDAWWSGEEQRITYVAFTRSRADLYLVVSKETAQNLMNNHKSFYDCFEVKDIEDFVP